MDNKKFIEDLKKKTNTNSDESLARILEISVSGLRKWKYGYRDPTPNSLAKIKEKLKELKK